MDHPAIDELWLDLAEGTLPEAEALAVRAHLAGCPACAARYQRLARAHELSARAGRAIRATAEPQPVPEPVARRALEAARAAGGGPPARRRAWAIPAFAAVAAAVALVVALRIGGAGTRDAESMRGTLALLTPPAAIRGPEDPLAAAARDAEERWRSGELHLRAWNARCPGGELHVSALADGQGRPVLIALREGDRTDLHLYRADGGEAGSARFAGAARLEFLLPPLPRARAQALLEARSCSPPGD